MGCDCMVELKDDYDIELVQGDYGSFLYNITDQNDEPLDNVESVIFTCPRLKTQIELLSISRSQFALMLDSSLTSGFNACTCTYDITVKFKTAQTSITVIHNGGLTILKKENKLNGSG